MIQGTHAHGLQPGAHVMKHQSGMPAYSGGTGLYRTTHVGDRTAQIYRTAPGAGTFYTPVSTPIIDQIYTPRVAGRPHSLYFAGDAYNYYVPTGSKASSVPLEKMPKWDVLHPDMQKFILQKKGLYPQYPNIPRQRCPS